MKSPRVEFLRAPEKSDWGGPLRFSMTLAATTFRFTNHNNLLV